MNRIWGQVDLLWKDTNFTWGEQALVQEILGGVDANTLIQPWMLEEKPWNPYQNTDKRKRLIKLICKIKNQEYSEEKEFKEFKISVDDIKMVIKAVSGVDLKVKD